MRRKAYINIVFSLMLQFVTILSGFIVPRLFIVYFGSEVNGLVNSIASFISYITLLQAGVGSVVKAALYKPLAKKDKDELNKIVTTADVFFKKIAYATVIYIALLSVVFPFLLAKKFDWFFTASLVIIIGASTVAQYFFGITYQMVLEGDQRSYIYSIVQIISVIINTIAIVALIKAGQNIQVVKGVSAIIYIVRPIIISMYTKNKYHINNNSKIDNSLIKQRWDGFIQAIALFIHQRTDIFVLTLFTSFTDVSIYSIYAMVTTGLSSLIDSIDKSIRAVFGNIIANNENERLRLTFVTYNTLMHIICTAFFSTACITVFKFIVIYVNNIQDVNYIQPMFGVIIISAELVYCLRLPYNSIIYAAGKFKDTKIPAGIEAAINILISCLLVNFLGISGVALGTLIAMLYRTVAFILYLHKNILELDIRGQLKRYGITLSVYLFNICILSLLEYTPNGYTTWVIYAGIIFIASLCISICFNYILDKTNTKSAILKAVKKN